LLKNGVKKRFRVTRTKDFRRIKEEGRTVYHPLLVLTYAGRINFPSRISAVASRSVGNAVTRNLTKRRIRACLQTRQKNIKTGWDLVFFSRKKITQATYEEICCAIEHLLKKADVWQEDA
jgi:ribonuclease P protein component